MTRQLKILITYVLFYTINKNIQMRYSLRIKEKITFNDVTFHKLINKSFLINTLTLQTYAATFAATTTDNSQKEKTQVPI
jgi:hypothetical protein